MNMHYDIQTPQPQKLEQGSILNIAFYRFYQINAVDELRVQLKQMARRQGLKGTIIVSPEGINGFMAGPPVFVESFWRDLVQLPGLEGLSRKDSYSKQLPFRKLYIKKKKEIIPFGIPMVDPVRRSAPYISADTLKEWFLLGRDFILLDTRNTYEIEKGTFTGAQHLGLRHFRDFPKALKENLNKYLGKPVVMFCTGGIRCEKAALYGQDLGLDAWQLEGGILKYFEKVGGFGFHGSCFVFDERTALDSELKPE